MTEREWQRWQDDMEAGQIIEENLKGILDAFETDSVIGLSRALQNHWSSDLWLTVYLHDGTKVVGEDLGNVETGNVRMLQVGCTIQGTITKDGETTEVVGTTIDLLVYDMPEFAADEFGSQVGHVLEEVSEAWHESYEASLKRMVKA